ncbi:nucleotidyltransferase family protein [Pseudooceanicola sp.]|uniref:nucleotidyltransferase family protein n=1 Tax=Pseudooceanicola sp. TaxID=1914328 RepID=UPI00260ECE99|nr:nucleotidyltransferase family protein [Pseudooceanicola sp.]MDF1855425.1 nucleotidyltransferase family protein [Pseudooceanicola sp.]
MSVIAVLLLAAGASSRMRGGDKLLEPVAGQPLVRLMAARALRAGAPVIVTLPPLPNPRAAALTEMPVARIPVQDASSGMAASIKAGVSSLMPGTDALMILPADMPEVDASDIAAMVAEWQPGEILRGAGADGTPGHPVIFPADLFEELGGLQGDVGAREVLVRHRARIRLFPLPDRHALTDLDTPEDWAAWRQHGDADL